MIRSMRYDHIVWDWNGTLLDDTWLCLEVFNRLLRAHGKDEITLERYRDEFEFPVKNYYVRMGFDDTPEAFDKIARDFMGEYERRRLECTLQPHVHETLESLHARGVKMSVFSAYKEDTLKELIVHYRLDSFFEAVTGQTHIRGDGKLDRAQGHLEKIGSPAQRLLMVGDSPHDYEVAQALNADCVLLSNGHFPAHRLSSLGAPVLDNLAQLAFV